MNNVSLEKFCLVLFLSILLSPLAAWADNELQHPDTYLPSTIEIMKQKASYDDKRDLYETYHPKSLVPPEAWKWMNFDLEKMKELTAELLGFAAPELVGKIAPEIKPGKYTYKDLEQYPGLKELFPKIAQTAIRAGGPPFVCNIMDFEIEPTRQFHMALPSAQITKKNLGKAKLDEDGYIVPGTWQGGMPFPRPSGKFKAQQVYYNYEKKCGNYDECQRLTGEGLAFDLNLKIDKRSVYARNVIKLMGRSLFAPFGWFDERAERRGEFMADSVQIYEPRANRGLITLLLRYDDPNKMDPTMIYLPQLRRIRKMSSTDTQDPMGDLTYDDIGLLRQKMTPKRFPYEFEIIDEREYLLPFSYESGTAWIDSKNGYALRDVGLMRRPCYVLQMTQSDPNYCYSKRVYYVDKETFELSWGECYDQRGRLYRTIRAIRNFLPETGQIVAHGTQGTQVDHIDKHSSCQLYYMIPSNSSRKDFTIQNLIKKGK